MDQDLKQNNCDYDKFSEPDLLIRKRKSAEIFFKQNLLNKPLT